LAIIPARGGSKGIPDKNLRPLAGKPLIAYVAEVVRASGAIDRLILSTDSPAIAELGASLGIEVPFLRPPELAQDSSPMQPVLEHAVLTLEKEGWFPQVVVVLQPTAPLRKPEHLRQAIALLEEKACDSVVSVVEIPKHYSPHYAMKIVAGELVNFLPEGQAVTRRQDVVPAYSRDGTVYAVRRDVLINDRSIYGKHCYPLILPNRESINLDTLEDWQLAENAIASGLYYSRGVSRERE
jgi:CMP-N-acetylneuraminic acid synthetase